MRVADGDHRGEDVVPGLRLHHHGVGEHAAVPADVAERLGQLAGLVAEPEAGVVRDVELAVGVGRQAVSAGVVVRPRAVHGGVVLRDVEVDRPGPQRGRQGLQGLVERGLVAPVEVVGEDAVLGGVLAEGVEQRVGHVGLEADRLGLADPFEEVDHLAPGVHATPADLPLGGEALAVVPGDLAGLLEGLGDLLLVPLGVGGPVADAAGRVEPDHAVGPHAQLAQPLGDPAALADLLQELPAPLALVHRRPAAGRRPDRRHHRADRQAARRCLVGQRLELVVGGVDVDVRGVQEQVEAVELDAVDLGRGGQVEHRVQADRGLRALALADHAGPGRVVQLGEVVGMAAAHGANTLQG